MEPRILSEYDSERNILFTEDHGELGSEEEVDAFLARYAKIFEDLGKKAYLVSNIDHLKVGAAVAEYYGRHASAVVDRYMLGFARWGTDNWARMTVRTSSRKADMPTRIFDTREEAVEEIERLKAAAGDA